MAAPEPANVPNVTPDEAQKLISEKKDLVVLDVRTADEFEKGHIAGAKNLDFFGDDFAAQLKGLDKSKEYLVHCASGARSGKTVKEMTAENFLHVYHMNGGFHAWEEAGKPVQAGK
jgi:rhodanese-related sulfurtransferase